MPYTDAQNAVVGRWDLMADTPGAAQPAWLEITRSGIQTLVGQFVGWHGSTRPISRVEVDERGLRFTIPAQFERGAGDLSVEGQLQGDQLSGTMVIPDGTRITWSGRRAPSLRRSAPPSWGAPITLFNGVDLAGWHVIQGESQWVVEDGILRNLKRGGNLVTDQKFDDFQLHLEFRYAPQGNSGVYLRGRYEVQVLEQTAEEPDSHLQGGVYGFLTPSEVVNKGPGEWQTYDITLVGRHVTIVLNGKTVITQQAIPGITGGALDSDEGAPGPIMLQGDHTACDYRNIVLTPAV
jgi:Domain of Unknown Function (DUF1080)